LKNYVGEIGFVLPAVTIVYDEGSADQKILLKSIYQVFNSFINLKLIETSDLMTPKNRRYLKNDTEIIVTTSISSLETITSSKALQTKTLVGFFHFSKMESEAHNQLMLSKLDRIIAVNDRTFDSLVSFIPQEKIRKLNLALDLRRFYGLKNTQVGIVNSRLGILVDEKVVQEPKLIQKLIADLLDWNGFSQIIIQTKDLNVQAYAVLREEIPENLRNQVIVLDQDYSIRQQIEFFKSIDLLMLPSDSLAHEVLRVEAEAAGLDVLSHQNGMFSRVSAKIDSFTSDLHTHDFRSLKFAYIRSFFGDGIVAKQDREAVVIPADAGFFSVFNTLVSIRAHWMGIHGFTRITPDWSINTILDFWKTRELTSYCYSSVDEGNVFESLFQIDSTGDKNFYDEKGPSFLIPATSTRLRLHSPNLFADPDFTYVYADRLYRSAGFYNWRKEMNMALNDLKPKEELVFRINDLFGEVTPEDLVIGMHVRHPSHAMEQPNAEIPIAEDYIRVAREILRDRAKCFDKAYIFLATDQDAVVNEFEKEFGQILLVFKDVTRVTNQETLEFQKLTETQKLDIGAQVQHVAAKDPGKWSSKLAEEIITDAWALARCQILVHAVSNVATAVTFINPELESFPLRRGDSYSSIKHRRYLQSISSVL
jgi:hypothetical protein